MSDNPDEWDFDDPRFLASAEQATSPTCTPLTYAERRKRDLAKAQARMREHQARESKAGRREREEEARMDGLATNLIAKETEEGRESKAMRMMKSVGAGWIGKGSAQADRAVGQQGYGVQTWSITWEAGRWLCCFDQWDGFFV